MKSDEELLNILKEISVCNKIISKQKYIKEELELQIRQNLIPRFEQRDNEANFKRCIFCKYYLQTEEEFPCNLCSIIPHQY